MQSPIQPREKDVTAETNQRFYTRIGGLRQPLRNDPRDASYRALWKSERETVLRERHPANPGSGGQADSDLFSPELRSFAAAAGAHSAESSQEISPEQLNAMLEVQELLAGLTKQDWVRLRRSIPKQASWQGLAAWLPGFIKQQRALDQAVAKVTSLEKIGGRDNAYELAFQPGQGYGSEDQDEADALNSSDKLGDAAGDFQEAFRVRAIEIAVEMLGRAQSELQEERTRLGQSRSARETLFAAVRDQNNQQELDRYVILRDRFTLEHARHNSKTADDLGKWLQGMAYQQIDKIKFVLDHLHEKPNVVFRLRCGRGQDSHRTWP